MKLFCTITSERGKPVNKSGNEYLNIDITVDRVPFCKLTLRPTDDFKEEDGQGYALYDESDNEIMTLTQNEIDEHHRKSKRITPRA